MASDSDLKYNIENLVTYPKSISVPANSSKEVSVQINAPAGNFSGELLGGIFVVENNQVNSKVSKGVTLKNQYEYVIGLQLQQNTDAVKPDLKFVKAYQTTDNYNRVIIYGEMDNDVPTLEKNVSVNAKITPENSSKVVLKNSKKNMSIAPDSYFNYPVDVNTLKGNSKDNRLKPGTYTMYLNVKANNGKNLWNLKRNFTITSSQNRKVNKAVPKHSKDIWIILGGILILAIVAGSVIFIYRKNKR